MIELALIGIAAGDPRHLTAEARAAIAEADVVLIPRKGREKAELAELRRALCAGTPVRPDAELVEFDLPRRDPEAADYLAEVGTWHDAIAERWSALCARHLPRGGRAAFLVWGDPALYDSSLRIAERLRKHGHPLTLRVLPGLTSIQLLTAAFAIPLTELGAPFLVTTGRRLTQDGWPAGIGTIVVMLDGTCAFRQIDPAGTFIHWGAYLGMEGEMLVGGPLATAGPEILVLREAARTSRGWIMDTYILRREPA